MFVSAKGSHQMLCGIFLLVSTAVMTQQLSVWTCAALLSQTSGLILPFFFPLQLLQITAPW